EEYRETIRKAMAYISARTCINFREDPYAKARVYITIRGECSTDPGMSGNKQEMWLGGGCY
ncbi:hypothetical protein OSTOST_11126, partial [Ostertagia ostertagi]